MLGGLTLAILLVGVIYMTLLRGLMQLRTGPRLLPTSLLHKVSPVADGAVVVVVRSTREAPLERPVLWAIYPLGYLIYALVARPHRRPLSLSVHRRG